MPYTIKQLPRGAVERALKVIAGAWKPLILRHLIGGPKRPAELKRLLPKISQKVLIQQLREMQEHGLVEREVSASLPLRVQYSATALGMSLGPVLGSLCEWGRRHAAESGLEVETGECTRAHG